MAATNNTREQQVRAVAVVLQTVPEAEQRTVLDVLFAEPRVQPPRGFKGRPAGDSNVYAPCGSSAAYQRHRRRKEPIDDACRKANTKAEMERRNRRRREKEAA